MMVVPLIRFQSIRHPAQFVSDAIIELGFTPSSPRLGYLPVTDADQRHCQDEYQDQSKRVHRSAI